MKRVLVTGGSGFLGGAIIKALCARGLNVRSISRRDAPALRSLGVETLQGDLCDFTAMRTALSGCDTVFHIAAKVGVWGSAEEYWLSNVEGTRELIQSCLHCGVKKFIYASTPSVVFDGRDHEGLGSSDAQYAKRALNHYQRTKIIAEKEVLAANGATLATVALRPHLIWGEGDPHLVKRLIEKAQAGRLIWVNGCRKSVDATYITNAVGAFLAAADRLKPGASCAGQAYFIGNGEAMPLAVLLNRILEVADLPPVSNSIPFGLAWTLGATLEWIYGLARVEREPLMTRFVAKQLATAHWYSLEESHRDLGWAPEVSTKEGLESLRNWLLKGGYACAQDMDGCSADA